MDVAKPIPVNIRWMFRHHMPAVLAIEALSFEFPWSMDDFVRCFRKRNCIGMVAEHEDQVVGFMVYELNKTRLHVLNFAVAGDYRRLGVGSQMIAKLIAKLSVTHRTRIVLEVREPNLAAQFFFRAHGFLATAILRRFFRDPTEDAYEFVFALDGLRNKNKATCDPDAIHGTCDIDPIKEPANTRR